MAANASAKILSVGLVALLATATLVVARDNTTPDEWLQKMSNAVNTLDYAGTVIRSQNGEVQPLKVVHKKIDGVINERIVIQEGNGMEIIRVGDEVHCILPDKKSVLVEHWDNASTLFATLPSGKIDPGAQYDVLILQRGQRIAGRSAVKLAIRPNDSLRFEHHYWLDEKTGFPLRTELIDQNGDIVDQLRFADIRLGSSINSQALAPSMSLDNFNWYTNPGRQHREEIETDWISDNLPAGFKMTSARQEILTGSEQPVTHIVYDDGLATVSVFIAELQAGVIDRSARRGASSSFSTEVDGFQITAVGEVPDETVQLIARSMRRR